MPSSTTLKGVLDSLGYEYDEGEFKELIGLLAAAQKHRLDSGNANEEKVTRTTALIVLGQRYPAVKAGLQAADLRWESFCDTYRLSEAIPAFDVEDVEIHEDFEQALIRYRESTGPVLMTPRQIALAIAQMAKDSGQGLVSDRLKKQGANLKRLPEALSEALAAEERAGHGPETEPPSEELPTVWLLHYKDPSKEEGLTRLFLDRETGKQVEWYSSKRIKDIKAEDPVIYWKDINEKDKDRGGLVGTGFSLGGPRESSARQKAEKWRYPTEVVELFPRDVLPRDEVIRETGLDLNWGLGSVLKVPREMAVSIDKFLLSRGKRGLFQEAPPSVQETAFIGDTPESEHDFLDRSELAFILAARLNRAWDEINQDRDERTGLFSRLRRHLGLAPPRENSSSFVVHIDAPWGGGKTSFANYLTQILNPSRRRGDPPGWIAELPLDDPQLWPEEFRRAWHVVTFNAWQHQHVDPPWWCFYQAIRGQCFRSVRTESMTATQEPFLLRLLGFLPRFLLRHLKWARLWDIELSWRIFNPKTATLVLTFFLTLAAATMLDLFRPEEYQKVLAEGFGTAVSIKALLSTTLVIIFGGATAIWSVLSAVADTLLPGTPDAARNYSLGSGDPLERFRRHFCRLAWSLNRPVIVVIDDIDRCKPDYVVALLQGIQTILRSSRVFFVLLGDRDWIERAFAEVHRAMRGISVGPEHTFGGRFVEKSIQLSLVLPDIASEMRTRYVRSILAAKPAAEERMSAAPGGEEEEYIKSLEETVSISNGHAREEKGAELQSEIRASQQLDPDTQQALIREIDRLLALRSASDRKAEEVTKHRLMPIAEVLPANPRQIKRIINGITLFQEIGRLVHGIRPDSREWCNLALWVVIMTEWPRTWATLSTYPGLVDRVLNPNGERHGTLPKPEAEKEWVATIRADEPLMKLLAFKHEHKPWSQAGLDTDAVTTLQTIMPAAGGELLERRTFQAARSQGPQE